MGVVEAVTVGGEPDWPTSGYSYFFILTTPPGKPARTTGWPGGNTLIW